MSPSNTSTPERKGGGEEPAQTDDVNDTRSLGWKEKVLSIGRLPASVWFIFGNEMCERFSFYGMRTILPIYFTESLGWSETTSTAVFHAFVMIVYFMPMFGAIIADTWLGKYKTILYLSLVLALGHIVKSVSAIPALDAANLPLGTAIGLLLIAIGTGGVKPCVSAFGGDQLNETDDMLRDVFFQLFYFAINLGSLFSTIITPILRDDVHCFGEDCYPLAFGVPAVLFIIAVAIFVFGSSSYVKHEPKGTVLKDSVKAIWCAVRNRFDSKYTDKRSPWIMCARDQYDEEFLLDVYQFLKICLLYLPLPVFWMGFDQQGSTWTFQATQMDGTVGPFTIKPDQFQGFNPGLILTLIPLTNYVIYPLAAYCRFLKTPIQRMATGMGLAACAFAWAGFLQIAIDSNQSESRLSMLWQIPQYLLITLGEVMFSISGLDFAYSQVSGSMKSLMQAVFMMTITFGNLLELVLSTLLHASTRKFQLFLSAAIIAGCTFLFILLACCYSYREIGKPRQHLPLITIVAADTEESHNQENSEDV